jgi:hypothetical protein
MTIGMDTRSLAELSVALEQGETSSEALTEAALARIEALDGALNSFITVDREAALAGARAADQRRNEPDRPRRSPASPSPTKTFSVPAACAPAAARGCWRISCRLTTRQ